MRREEKPSDGNHELVKVGKMPSKPQAIFPGKMTESVRSDFEDLEAQIARLTMTQNAIQQLMKTTLKDKVHYGTFKGIDKKCLLKAVADCLCTLFKFRLSFEYERFYLENDHREYIVKSFIHSASGEYLGMGFGSCSTMEPKYRYRLQKRVCPSCGKDAIMVSKYDPGFYCNTKNGGCGANFPDDDPSIINQVLGKGENSDIAEVYNTVLKMATKRAQTDAVIRTTGCSEVFTQDLEDMSQFVAQMEGAAPEPAKPEPKTAKVDPPASAAKKPTQAAAQTTAQPKTEPKTQTKATATAKPSFESLLGLMNVAATPEHVDSLKGYFNSLIEKTADKNGAKYSVKDVLERGAANVSRMKEDFRHYLTQKKAEEKARQEAAEKAAQAAP